MAEGAIDLAPTLGHPDVIRLFEQGLVMAKAGKIVGVGIVAVMDTGQPTISIGGVNPYPMYFGADLLKDTLRRQLGGPPSPIIKVRN